MVDASLPHGRVGRAQNGNAILDSIEVEAISKIDPTQTRKVKLDWAWADVEQPDEDFRVTNALTAKDGRVWAVDAHHQPGARVALLHRHNHLDLQEEHDFVSRLGMNRPIRNIRLDV